MHNTLIYKAIFDSLPIHAYWINEKGCYQGSNGCYQKFLGLNDNNDNLIGKNYLELLRSLAISITDVPLSSDHNTLFERTYYLPSNKTAKFKVSQLKYAEMTVFYEEEITVFFDSITLLEEKNKNLSSEKDKLETYLNNIVQIIPASVYWKDKNCILLGSNQFHAQIAGFSSPLEVIGKTEHDFIWKDQAAKIIESDKKIMQSGKGTQLEEIATLTDGNIHTFLTSKEPLLDKNNNVIGIVGVSLDITDRKIIEKQLAEALRAKSTFMSIVSHEIKGPLANVKYVLNIIEQDILKKSFNVKEILKLIEKEKNDINRSIDTINNLIQFINFDFSKKEAAHKNSVNIRSELLKVFDEFEQDNEKNIGFDIFDDKAPTSAKINLNIFLAIKIAVGNAAKYSKKNSEVSVHIEDRKKDKKDYLVFTIRNSGVGINKETLKKLFNPLLHTHVDSEKVLFSAPAIRLSYAKKIAETLGGELNVTSKENEWTKVTISAPYEPCKHIDPSISLSEFYPSREKKISKRKLNILVVEDNKMTSELITNEIRKLKHTADPALNSLDAQRLAKSKDYDAIFMDISLPGIDGVELRERLSNPDPESYKPIMIAVTSHDTEENIEYFLEQGFANVITKPFTKEDIIACIETIQKVLNDLEQE